MQITITLTGNANDLADFVNKIGSKVTTISTPISTPWIPSWTTIDTTKEGPTSKTTVTLTGKSE